LSKQIIDRLLTHRLIPIARIDDPDKSVLLTDILIQNHLPVIEILFQTDAAHACIKRIRTHHPDMLIGAGTIITPALAMKAKEAGADFLVAPGFNPRVVDFCLENSIPFIPGADSPSLIETALDKGITLVKFYPAQASGGIEYLKAIAGSYNDIRIMPAGGINPGNLADYLAYEKVVACGASWPVPSSAIATNDFDLIRKRVRTITRARG
jgi:2-dehydro-3-deoxyphosphogluconate aldolase/(4S)-4-hydroxy-2-oxoglutarate aldolase